MFSDYITLFEVGNRTTDMGGRESYVISQKEAFCDRKSVRQNEFYQAYQAGFTTTAVFKMWREEYNNENVIKFEDRFFTVIRTYEIADFVELTCTARHGLFDEATR